MATKAAHTQFNRSVAAYLQSIGAENRKQGRFESEWILETKEGILCVSTREPERDDVFSIFCLFEDQSRQNLHSYSPDDLLSDFKEQIAPLLIKTLTT